MLPKRIQLDCMVVPCRKGNKVLIVGPSGSGKTTLFHQGMKSKPVHVVDLPGHPRLRHKVDSSVNGARGVIFLVDSADFMPSVRDTAEYLYDVLSHPALSRGRVPVLVACNKSDLGAKAHTIEFIRKKLEKEVYVGLHSAVGAVYVGRWCQHKRGCHCLGGVELSIVVCHRELLRSTRGTLEGGTDHQIPLTNASEPFSFTNAKSKITVESCSALKNDLSSVEGFVRSCVPA
eukprot:scaffold50307_cov56-Prasinocladus_malaysianus.AAC.1